MTSFFTQNGESHDRIPPLPASRQTIVVTGASSGIGALTVRALARAGHIVYAGIRETAGRNADAVTDLTQTSAREHIDLYAVDMDVSSQPSVDAAIARIIEEQGHLDVIVHNAGHMILGPSEAFTPEEYAASYDVNVLTQRVNRAALPYLRSQGSGLLIWVSSSSVLGVHTPFIAPTLLPRTLWTRSLKATLVNSSASASTLRS